MGTQPDPGEFKKSGAHLTMPNGGNTLSGQLKFLSAHHSRASTWWAAEVAKLVGPAQMLEAKVVRMSWQGLVAGIVVGLTLAWYLRLF